MGYDMTDLCQMGLLRGVLEIGQVRRKLRDQDRAAPGHGSGQLGELRQS